MNNLIFQINHPAEVLKKAQQKKLKHKEKESLSQEKTTRKKQKETQKLDHPPFSEFLKSKFLSLE